MSQVNAIIEAVGQKNFRPEELANVINWKKLTLFERDKLITQVYKLWETSLSLPLLEFLLLVSKDDGWYYLKVIGLVAQHPETIDNNLSSILDLMGELLIELTPSNEVDQKFHLRCQALRASLKAQEMERKDQVNDAIEQYYKAYKIYSDLGLSLLATNMYMALKKFLPESVIESLNQSSSISERSSVSPQPTMIFPTTSAPSSEISPVSHTVATAALKYLEDKKNLLQQQISQLQKTLTSLEQKKKELEQEIQTWLQNIEKAKKDIKNKEDDIQRLKQQLEEYGKVVAETDSLKNQNDQSRYELGQILSDLSLSQGMLNQTKSDLKQAQHDLDKTKKQLDQAQIEFNKAQLIFSKPPVPPESNPMTSNNTENVSKPIGKGDDESILKQLQIANKTIADLRNQLAERDKKVLPSWVSSIE